MIHILGRDTVKQMQTFDDVAKALDFDMDVYLGAFMANPLGIELKGEVIYNMEYLHDNSPLWSFGYMETLRNNKVIDFSLSNIDYLKNLGIEAIYMPYGYHEALDKRKEQEQSKEIDVLFIGSMHFPRRQKIINDLSKYCKVTVAYDLYGEDLDNLIGKAKVHLNMHHAEGQPIESVRLNYLLANGCSVVSERGSCEELNTMYKSCLMFSEYDGLVNTCLSALETPQGNPQLIKSFKHDCSVANKQAKGVN